MRRLGSPPCRVRSEQAYAMGSGQTVFGAALSRLRLAAALSQEELAERAGLSARAVSDLERGIRQRPRPESLRLLADALDLAGSERQQFIAAAQPGHQASAARPPADRRVAVPRPVTPLLGRERDQAAVIPLLRRDDVRLVTLTGPGGVGKTRLGIEIAHALAADFPDGVVFVDLAPLSNAALVLPAIATALNIRVPDTHLVAQAVISALGDARLLLLLDNCEHVLGATPAITQVLASCAGLSLLATSREALRIHGEREWPVVPLSVPDPDRPSQVGDLAQLPAVALFCARAEARDPEFALTDQNARTIALICHRVDGLPLGIELAAARVKLLSPEVLADRLAERLPFLTYGARDAPPRQRTLRHTLAWSYDLLTPEEQTLFCRLGIFVGGWTLAAAEAVTPTTDAVGVLAGLGSLLDKSLIRIEHGAGEPHYGMLETLREFAIEQLAQSPDEHEMRARHAAYFLALAERGAAELTGGAQHGWRTRLERDYPNLREALAWLEAQGHDERSRRMTMALNWYWYEHGPASEGLAQFERVLARTSAGSKDRVAILLAAERIAYTIGAYARAARWLQEGENLARAADDVTALAHIAKARGEIAEHRGDEAAAQAFYAAGLDLALGVGNARLIGELRSNLSDAAWRRGEHELAEVFAREAIPAIHASGDLFVETMNLGNFAQNALARGEISRAAAALEDSLGIAVEIESRWSIIDIVAGTAAISAALGHDEQAVRLLSAADAERGRSGHPRLPHFGVFDQTSALVRARIDDQAWREGWQDGHRLTLDEALVTVRTILSNARMSRPVVTNQPPRLHENPTAEP